MNRFLRDNGFGVAAGLGVALLVVGLATGNPTALVVAIVLLVIDVFGARHGAVRESIDETSADLLDVRSRRYSATDGTTPIVARGQATAPLLDGIPRVKFGRCPSSDRRGSLGLLRGQAGL